MRTVRVDEPDSSHTMLWLAAGAVLGVVAGVMLSDRIKGKRGSLRSLASRGRRFAAGAWDSLGPLLETARELKQAWDEPDEEEEDEELDLVEDTDDELDEEGDEDDDEEAEEDDALDARVLEAFVNDPILMESAVEIEERDPGVIILHGRMRNAKEAKHAVTLARGVPGVERVRTRLTVR
jgi:BON domain